MHSGGSGPRFVRLALLTLALSALAVLGNYFHLPLFFSISFIFGSVFALLALAFLGPLPAVAVMAAGGAYTLVLWGHPYALMIFVAEIVFVAVARRKIQNLVLADTLYWLLIGSPLALFLYTNVLNVGFDAAAVIALKQPLNGIFNAIIASLTVAAIQHMQARWARGSRVGPLEIARTTVGAFLFNTILLTALVSSAVPLIIDTERLKESHEVAVLEQLRHRVEDFQRNLAILANNGAKPEMTYEVLRQDLSDLIEPNGILVRGEDAQPLMRIGDLRHIDESGTLNQIRENFHLWVTDAPIPSMARWAQGLYLLTDTIDGPTGPVEITVATPAGPLAALLHKERLHTLILMALVCLAAIAVSSFLSALVSAPVRRLESFSQMLPEMIEQRRNPEFPSSSILEYHGLSAALKDMTDRLVTSLRTVETMRDTLEIRVQERTSDLERLSLVASKTTNAVVITDAAGVIEWVNEGFTRITGYGLDDVIGRKPGEVLQGPDTDPETTERMREKIAHTEPFQEVILNYHKSGESYWTEINCNPIFDENGQHSGFIAIESDVTNRVASEEKLRTATRDAEAANKAKSDFLANMSHEIRTPMNAIIGFTGLALQTPLTEKQQDYLNKVTHSSNALLGIINDILDFSKVEAGALELERIGFELDSVLDHLSGIMTSRAEDKSLEMLFQVDPAIPRELVGDPLRLGQVLTNLATNAIKFTEAGEILVSVRLAKQTETSQVLRFEVRDTGVGMSAEAQQRLFRPFTQADLSITRQYGGTGLGLSICLRLVELMDGEIAVESHLGEGSCFSFTARFGVSERGDISGLVPRKDLQGLHVLVVDDNACARTSLIDMLSAMRFTVKTVGSEAEMWENLATDSHLPAELRFRLVILDADMTEGTQRDVLQRVNNELGKDAPAIVFTYPGNQGFFAQGENAALSRLQLSKPFTRQALFNIMVDRLDGGAWMGTAPEEKQRRTADEEALAGVHVLLVEDNEINQQVAREILEGVGVSVEIAGDGKQAVSRLISDIVANDRPKFDAILMDLQMPRMDGYSATRVLRDNRAFDDVPIIAMTAHALSSERQKCLDAGMNDHITKPIDPHRLFAALAKWTRFDDSGSEPGPTAGPSLLPDEVPGIDMPAMRSIFGGKEKVVHSLLSDFLDRHADSEQLLRDAARARDFKNLRSELHRLKGVTGNLRATEVYEATRDFEEVLIKDADSLSDDVLTTHLDAIADTLQTLLSGIGDAVAIAAQNAEGQPSAPERAAGEIDLDALKTAAARLQEMLAAGYMTAEEELPALRDALSGNHQAELSELEQDIDALDFTAATTRLTDLVAAATENARAA